MTLFPGVQPFRALSVWIICRRRQVRSAASAVEPIRPSRHWRVRELAVVGIFAAISKAASIVVALVGGGMNPLTLVLKSLVFTALLMVLLFKVRKIGTLLLFVVVTTIFTALMMGAVFYCYPPMLLAGFCAEGLILVSGSYRTPACLVGGVAAFDLLYRLGSLGLSWLFVREQPQLMWLVTIMVAIGYSGALAGLYVGTRFIKELRHAGIVRQ